MIKKVHVVSAQEKKTEKSNFFHKRNGVCDCEMINTNKLYYDIIVVGW